ncbi:MAG TPA: DUF401 family protein, partial [Halanaerobiales bacterium]|nr:DUF401 family protein [Halanaerobiales bacterium]
MQTIGFIAAFVLLIILSSKKVNLGLSLLLAALITGISSSLPSGELFIALFNGALEATSLQLMVIVALISGMGYLMKVNGDLRKMIASLNSLLNNTRIMTMLIPVIIGTLNVPGGAILSAPMVEKSGDKIKLDPVSMSAINIFFRHIAFLVYPLYTALIALISLLKINIIEVIKY